MKLKVWGARGSVPAPGPRDEPLRRQHLVRAGDARQRRAADPRRRDGDPDARARPRREAERINILLTHLHLDHIQGLMFFPPCFRVGVRDHRSGARRRRRRRWRTGSPATSRRRSRRSRSASCPARSPSATPRPASGSSAARGSAPRRSPTAGRRSGYRITDGETTSGLHPRPRAGAGRAARRARPGVDLGLRPRPRRRPADPRLPVRRRRVPAARRLGPLGDRRTRSRSHAEPRPSACCCSTTTRCTPTSSSTSSQRPHARRWAELGGDATELEMGMEGGELDARRRRLSRRVARRNRAPQRRRASGFACAAPRSGRLSTGRYNAPDPNLRHRDNELGPARTYLRSAYSWNRDRRHGQRPAGKECVSDETKVRGRRAPARSRRRAARGPGRRHSPTPRTWRSRSPASSTRRSGSTRCG